MATLRRSAGDDAYHVEVRLVIVSDTHRHNDVAVADGDVLIHAGDMTMDGGTLPEIEEVGRWLATLPHRHKVVVAGNHDWAFQINSSAAKRALGDVTYLQDSGMTIGGLIFWGSPWQPWFYDWAFNLRRGAEIAEKWALIPPSTDVLITHGPPRGILDKNGTGESVGCEELQKRIGDYLDLKVHAFGHIHESSGMLECAETWYVNACICNGSYSPTNPTRVVDIAPRPREGPVNMVLRIVGTILRFVSNGRHHNHGV